MNIHSVPSNEFFDNYATPGNFDIVPFSWIGDAFPSTNSSIYAKPTKGKDGKLKIQQNFARIGTDKIDKLFDKAGQTLDEQQAYKTYNKIDGLLWDEVHSLTLYQRPQIYATKGNLANIGAFGFFSGATSGSIPIYENVGFTKKG